MLEVIFRDECDRTTTSGLGTHGSTTYTSPTGANDCHVNGSYIVSNVAFGFSRYVGMPRVVTGAVQFDFWVASGTDDNVTYEVDGGWELQPGGRYYHLLAKAVCNGDGTFTVSGFGRIISSFSVTSGRWYRVRVEWDGTTERVKCWDRDNVAEPSTWGSSGTTTVFGGLLTITSSGTPKIEINGPSSSAREVRIDNIVIWDTFAQTLEFSDDFNRTESVGLGDNWAYSTDDSSQPSPGVMSVDGDLAHVAANEWESQTNPDIPYLTTGYVRWDFMVPANTSDTAQIGFNFASGTFYAGNPMATHGVWRAYRDNVVNAYVEFYPDGSDWWTVWFHFGGTSGDYVKVWPRDTPGEEPAWTLIPETPDSTPPNYSHLVLDVYYAPAAEDMLFDNLFVWSPATGGGTPVTNLGSFSLAAEAFRREFALRAIVRDTPRRLFDLEAVIARGWHFDAWVIPNRRFSFGAVAKRSQPGSFPVSAQIATTAPTVFLLDAFAALRHAGSFPMKAWIDVPLATRAASFDLAAFVVGTLGAFSLNAQVSSPQAHAAAFSLDADVSATYRLAGFSVAAVALQGQRGGFDLEAIVTAATRRSSSFGLGSRAAGRIVFEAFVPHWFDLRAEVRDPSQEFGLDAWVSRTGYGWFAFNAVVARGFFTMNAIAKATRGDIIPFIASVIRRTSTGFGLDAHVAGGFALDAYVQPAFRLSAEIASPAGQKYWPVGSGGYGNPPPIDAGTGQPWRPPHHQVRIEILIDGVDVTKHVELPSCNFTQAAGNSPGTFVLPLRGVFNKYDGGEAVLVNIDGFRQFGGIVTTVDHAFHYPYVAGEDIDEEHPNQQPITLLQGADFNVLFDRVQIYNVPWVKAHGTHGDYQPIDPLPADLTDRSYIQTVFSKYIDTVWRTQFGYTTYVEEATAHPSPETPFTVETGQTLRVFLAALSQMTNQIWYLDPYYELHSHSRANANAPRAITDGTGDDSGGDPTGGIHCRELTVVWSIENMANDTIVYGTLAETVDGEIIANRRMDEESIAKFGLWQHSEVRSDLHLASHVAQRGYALQVRSNRRIHRAQCRIFEKGFQAGQVVSLFSGEYGVAENIPITQLAMTFLTSQGEEDGRYYGVPAYDLTMSNEPDPPWNLYDALPWQFQDYPYTPQTPAWRTPHIQHHINDPGTRVTVCRGDGWATVWAPDCASTATHGVSVKTVFTDLLSPPPWCVIVRLPATAPSFSVAQVMLSTDDSGYDGKSSFTAGFALIGSDWTLSVGAAGQTEGGAGAGGATQVVIPGFIPNRETYARIQCLQDGTVNARLWKHGEVEPTGWQAVAHAAIPPDIRPLFGGGLQPSSRLKFTGAIAADFAVAGQSGWGWAWFEPLRTDVMETWRKTYSPYSPATWTTTFYPGGSRPFEVPGDGGNVIDAVTGAGGNFPRGDSWEVTQRTTFSTELMLNSLAWGFSFVPSNATGDANDPRMLTEVRNYVGFKAPPGATRFELDAVAYANVFETGLFGIGSQPGPTGEGAISFEVWTADYRGRPPTEEPNHDIIYSSTAPDYTYKDGDGGPITLGFPFHVTRPIHGGDTVQIAGKITNSWDELMHSHHEGPLLGNGLKRVMELKLTEVRLRFFWDAKPCGEDDVLGDCVEAGSDPYWETGWGQETTAADKHTGAFVARLPVALTTLSVYAKGKLLIPDDDYTSDGDVDHRLFHLTKPGPRCLRLVYLANTMTVTTEPPQPGPHTGNKTPDRVNQPDTGGVGR